MAGVAGTAPPQGLEVSEIAPQGPFGGRREAVPEQVGRLVRQGFTLSRQERIDVAIHCKSFFLRFLKIAPVGPC